MKLHKVISTILHPTVLPTVGAFLYFYFCSTIIRKKTSINCTRSNIYINLYSSNTSLVFFEKFRVYKRLSAFYNKREAGSSHIHDSDFIFFRKYNYTNSYDKKSGYPVLWYITKFNLYLYPF